MLEIQERAGRPSGTDTAGILRDPVFLNFTCERNAITAKYKHVSENSNAPTGPRNMRVLGTVPANELWGVVVGKDPARLGK